MDVEGLKIPKAIANTINAQKLRSVLILDTVKFIGLLMPRMTLKIRILCYGSTYKKKGLSALQVRF